MSRSEVNNGNSITSCLQAFRCDLTPPTGTPDNRTTTLSPSRYSGAPRSRPPSVRRSSPKELSEAGLTEIVSEVDDELPTDPRLTEIFDNVR